MMGAPLSTDEGMEEAGLKWLDASFVLFTLAGIGAGAASLALTHAMASTS